MKYFLSTYLILLILITLISNNCFAQKSTNTSLTCILKINNIAIANAEIHLQPLGLFTQKSDFITVGTTSNGTFTFTQLKRGKYRLMIKTCKEYEEKGLRFTIIQTGSKSILVKGGYFDTFYTGATPTRSGNEMINNAKAINCKSGKGKETEGEVLITGCGEFRGIFYMVTVLKIKKKSIKILITP